MPALTKSSLRTAVIYSGQARTFAKTFPNQWWHVLRKLPNPTVFCSVADDADASSMRLLEQRFDISEIHYETVTQPQISEPAADPQYLAMYPPSATPQAILRQLWSLNRAWEFFCSFQPVQEFDIVVRLRPDLAFMRFELPRLVVEAWEAPITKTAFTPWWSRWGGVNDRVAVLGSQAACHYFSTYSRLSTLLEQGAPLHPETLVAASLGLGDIRVRPLVTEFVAVRADGTTTPFDPTVIDIADYARSRLPA